MGILIDLKYGQIYEGQWDEQGNQQGHGQCFDQSGYYIGEFKNSNFHGQGIQVTKNIKDEGLFKGGWLQQGTRTDTYGNVYRGVFDWDMSLDGQGVELENGTKTDKDGNVT